MELLSRLIKDVQPICNAGERVIRHQCRIDQSPVVQQYIRKSLHGTLFFAAASARCYGVN